jgi:hypothetical protein
MPSPETFFADLAVNLAADLITRGADHLRDAAFGDDETRALRRAWEEAFRAMLDDVAADLDEEQVHLLDDLLRDFVRAEGVADALLDLALRQQQSELDLIYHSDQGSQYTAGDYQQLLKDRGIRVSMDGDGNWYDNSPMKSFFGTLKSEWVYRQVYHTHEEARSDLFYYIELLYNQHFLHSSLGYCSIAEYEQRYYEEQTFD